MTEVVQRCVFVDRLSIDVWVVRYESGLVSDIQYHGRHVPVLFGVEYAVQMKPKVKVVDGRRLWNKEVHSHFFPNVPFTETWNAVHYIRQQTVKSKECTRWLRFDIDFHLQSLVPSIPAMEYMHLVKQGNEGLETLVYKIGGVDPLALRRAGAHMDLVRDAWNLKLVTDLTKRYHRATPWLGDEECQMFTVDDTQTQESFSRLVERGALVQQNVGTEDEPMEQIALAWAALMDAGMPNCRGEHRAGIESPVCRKKVNRETVEGDLRLRMDHMIDQMRLPMSMSSKVTWSGVPSQRLGCVTEVVNKKTLSEAMKHVKSELNAMNSSSVVVFSTHGNIGIDVVGSWFCEGNGEFAEVKMCAHNASMLLVQGVETEKSCVFESFSYAGRQRWDKIHEFAQRKALLDTVVGVFVGAHELDWCAWIDKLGENTKRVLVLVN